MSVEVYSECRVEANSTSSGRCLIELRQHDIGDYALRAIDLNNQKRVRPSVRK